MNDTTLYAVIAAAVLAVIALAAWANARRKRSAALASTFGGEYDRAVKEYGGTARAEKELAARGRRFERAHLRGLTPADRDRFLVLWQSAQSRFVDSPKLAIQEADRLVEEVMHARGYPTGDRAQRLADVAIGHPHLLDHYRDSCDLAHRSHDGAVETEGLRQAMVHYRALFEDLLETTPVARTA